MKKQLADCNYIAIVLRKRYFGWKGNYFQQTAAMKNSQLTGASPIVNANASTLTTPLNFTTTTRFGIKSQASKDARTISNAVDTLFKHIFPFIHLGEPPLWLLCSLATQCSQIFWGLLLCLFFSFFLIFPKWPIFVQMPYFANL